MVLVVVAIDKRIDLRDPGERHHGLDFLALFVIAAVDEHALRIRHHDQRRIGLLHIDVVNELPIPAKKGVGGHLGQALPQLIKPPFHNDGFERSASIVDCRLQQHELIAIGHYVKAPIAPERREVVTLDS
jgi:hypothetical protein